MSVLSEKLSRKNRFSLTQNPVDVFEVDLLEAQKNFFRQFKESGFNELFEEINPIEDSTGNFWRLSFESFSWGEPEISFHEASLLGRSYEAPVYAVVKLLNKKTSEIKKQKIFLCDMPLMSERASFIYNGSEKVVVFQILRSEGLLLSESKASTPKRKLYSVKLMPQRGNWYEFELNRFGVMSVKIFQKRSKILLTTLLRALGFSSDDDIRRVLSGCEEGDVSYVETTLKKDPTSNTEEALLEIHRRLRPEDALSLESARNLLDNIFFNKRRFYLGRVGRYKLNKKLGIKDEIKPEDYQLNKTDIVNIVRTLLKLNHGMISPDDIDSLSNRRIRGVNELLSEKLRLGVLAMEKSIKDKMSAFSTDEKVTPSMLVNSRPLASAINQFFGSSALVRFMDQINILSEIEAKRRITAGGARGLTPERATFSVRDVHNSHYSKLCPITTPEGPSVGMVNQMAIYARVNSYGFLEAPYNKVISVFDVDNDDIKDTKFKNRYLDQDLEGIAKKGDLLTEKIVEEAKKNKIQKIFINPFVSDEIIYLDADEEGEHLIASYDLERDEFGNITQKYAFVRDGQLYSKVKVHKIDCIDVSPSQIGGLGILLIPFAGNDDPNRTLIGAKTQTQAVPLLRPEPPIVGTGFESLAAKASGRCVYAEEDGVVEYADASVVVVNYNIEGGFSKRRYDVQKFVRTNQNTCFSQKVVVTSGQPVKKGDLLIDGPCSVNGEISLGTNLRVAYVVYEGYNYEDGIVISERLVRDDILTSIHIQEYSQEIRETKLGNEVITRDIPNVNSKALRNLDENGLVRIGAHVESNDILVGIISPKGEAELTAEEKLLRAIFGEYARDVRDNSLRMPNGEHGVVVGVQVLDRERGAKLEAGVLKQVKVWVAKTHKISIGDKLTGFHGDKGVVTKILPEYDMPYTKDGEPVDIILGPSSMVRRMNLGQLIEAHLGAIAHKLGISLEVQPFSKFSFDDLFKLAKEKNVDIEEKVELYDPKTGEPYDQKIAVGFRYFLKLDHLADHKVHARSTGPYTLVTQQPVRGKAQKGGRRFGEMEVWTLEAHGVPYLLHEMLTIKSDDMVGRAAAYKSIITNQKIVPPKIPESFTVFEKELAGLGIKLTKLDPEIDYTYVDMSLEEIVDAVGNSEAGDSVQTDVMSNAKSTKEEEYLDLSENDVNFE
ncbi:DNA-directed RNA polymerase subunit beta [Candidatus Dojkabacteria bacterium]|uniref:DNA-directed RNA polymerase subunit beta n=1 Tax=Candidatus Dojkabacteria bacterium TaxID=2099670 RepID=A0A3M0Z0X4_9BACT|nr:MAG: DNA-directed RNA polymerase subunit beta [Candidatus Dojkabacteria bacterium]